MPMLEFFGACVIGLIGGCCRTPREYVLVMCAWAAGLLVMVRP